MLEILKIQFALEIAKRFRQSQSLGEVVKKGRVMTVRWWSGEEVILWLVKGHVAMAEDRLTNLRLAI